MGIKSATIFQFLSILIILNLSSIQYAEAHLFGLQPNSLLYKILSPFVPRQPPHRQHQPVIRPTVINTTTAKSTTTTAPQIPRLISTTRRTGIKNPSSTVRVNNIISSPNATTTTPTPDKQQLNSTTIQPQKEHETSNVPTRGSFSREEIEAALNMPGVKCGTVPVYEKAFKRSFNTSAVEGEGDFRILHGLDAIHGEWPWIVRIQECKEKNKCFTCTGTLLNSRWIITAGHCGYKRSSLEKFNATLGLYDLIVPDKGSISSPIDKIIVHPDYNDLTNDLTLMRLAKRVEFNDFIQPACLIHATRNILDYTKGKALFTVGYGLTEGMTSAIKLQKLQINTKQPNECNSDKLGGVQLRRGTMCISPLDNHKGGSCKGDSGGPDLVYDVRNNKWIIFGTVSYGPADCDREEGEKWLTVSVDLSNYRNWILKTILLNGS